MRLVELGRKIALKGVIMCITASSIVTSIAVPFLDVTADLIIFFNKKKLFILYDLWLLNSSQISIIPPQVLIELIIRS